MDEFDFDITRGCNLKIIVPHSGGAMPTIAGRIKDRYPKDPQHEEYIPNGVIAELQKFYLDIAHPSYPYPMAAMMKFALPDRLPGLGISANVMRAIERENAEKLLPRLKV